MERGDVVFFKQVQAIPKKGVGLIQLQGFGFGLLLGHLPPHQPMPSKNNILRLIGGIGYLKFDDVAEFLGEDMGALCVKKFNKKYYGEALTDENQTELPLALAPVPDEPKPKGKLLDLSVALHQPPPETL